MDSSHGLLSTDVTDPYYPCVSNIVSPHIPESQWPQAQRPSGRSPTKGRPQGAGRNPDGAPWQRFIAQQETWIFQEVKLMTNYVPCYNSGTLLKDSTEERRKLRLPGFSLGGQVFTELTGQETYPVYSPGCGYLLTRNLCDSVAIPKSNMGGCGSTASHFREFLGP